ncbi:NAD(P)/FAD-dependent oxidoreductase [Bosea thiooxidans]
MSVLRLAAHVPDDVLAQLAPGRAALPARADAVVIGGGIMGCASAYYLARAGFSVALVERDTASSQQSGRNWGFVRTQYRDPLELPLAVEALSMWPDLEAELGEPMGWRRSGCVFVAGSDAEYDTFERWQETTRSVASGARMLSPGQTKALLPALSEPAKGALFTEADGQAEPAIATMGFARAAVRAGVQVVENCGVFAIESAAGSVTGVLTEHGRIDCGIVVCAAGAQAHRLLSPLGLDLPQQTVRSTVSLTAPLPPLSDPCFCGYGIGLRQRADGSCIIAADSSSDIDLTLDSVRAMRFFLPEFMRHRAGFSLHLGRPFIDDLHERLSVPQPERAAAGRRRFIPANRDRAGRTGELVERLFPAASGLAIVKSWAGLIDVLPDALPVLDAPDAVSGLIVATGFSGHGFGLGPAVGRHVARFAKGESRDPILAPLRLERFARGTYARAHAPL